MKLMHKRLAMPLISAAFMFGATIAYAEDSDDKTVERGHELLKANCSRCHAITMDDSSAHEEAPPFRVVVTRYPPRDLAESLAEGIISGHPDMPEFVFQPPEIEAILAYLDSLTPAEEATPEAGEEAN